MLNIYNGCAITITNKATGKAWFFDFVANVNIVEDVTTLTDTCTIEVPKKVSWQGITGGAGVNPPIKRGDKILVQLGYDGQLVTRFDGYVKNVHNKTPLRIECEDGMFVLKLKEIAKKAFRNCTLEDLITYLLAGTGIGFKLIDKNIKLGNYRIKESTAAAELNELKKEYGLMAYFRNGDLYVGLTYPFDKVKTERIVYGKRLIEESLEYKRAEDIKLKVKAVSMHNGNEIATVTLGDADGELIEVKLPGLNKAELKAFAQQTLNNAKYDGVRGSVTTFGEPVLHKADRVQLELETANKGTYVNKRVEVQFGTSGYRQVIELGFIVSK